MSMRSAVNAIVVLTILLADALFTSPSAAAAEANRARPAPAQRGITLQAAPAQDAQITIPTGPNGIQNLTLDPTGLRAHVLQPRNIFGVTSDDGLHEGQLRSSMPQGALPRRALPQRTFPPRPIPGQGNITDVQRPSLDVNAFGESLHAALMNSVAGYAMQLRRNGNPIYTLIWNWSRTPDDGSQGWNLDRRMHIASVSKLITAMAMTKLLNDRNISYDAKIINYLPTHWQKGPNISQISFRQLLTHRSGFSTGGSSSDYLFMKAQVAAGVTSNGAYDYENMNFGLCRILLAIISGNVSKNLQVPPLLNDIIWDYATIESYRQYVQQNLFAPAGVGGATLDSPPNATLAYNFPVNDAGWNSGNLASMSGGAGWHMTVNELLAVMGRFRRGGSIMSAGDAQNMLGSGFGIDLTLDTPAGRLYNKNGLWRDNAGRTEQSLAYFLPEGMELVVLTNSPVSNPGQFFRDIVTNIYTANIN